MTRLSLVLSLALGLTACAHSSVHGLDSPPSLPSPTRACTIGVGRFADGTGLDFSSDLRDYLRANGPCRQVIFVEDAHDERADAIVSGSVTRTIRAYLDAVPTPQQQGGGVIIGTSSLPLLVGGGLFAGGAAGKDSGIEAAGAGVLAAGAVLLAIGIFDLVDNGGRKELDAAISVAVDITHRDGAVDHFTLSDDATVRDVPVQHAPPDNDADVYASLQPALLERVFEHVAARLDSSMKTVK